MNVPFWREMPEWTMSFSRKRDSVHSRISLQKGAFVVPYGFRWSDCWLQIVTNNSNWRHYLTVTNLVSFWIEFWKWQKISSNVCFGASASCQLKSSTMNKCNPKFFVVWHQILQAFLTSISFKTKWSTFLINQKSC